MSEPRSLFGCRSSQIPAVHSKSPLTEAKPLPAEVADAALQSTGVMQDKAVLGPRSGVSQPKFGFVLKNARPIVPEGTVQRSYGRFPAKAFPLSDVGDTWLNNRRAQVTHKKRFSEADRNDHDQVIGVYVPYAAKLHPELFRKHMAKDRADRAAADDEAIQAKRAAARLRRKQRELS
jgi:hypothetical protein